MPASELNQKLTRYLLGELSQIERTDIEDRYLSGEDSLEELLVAEDELIDDYVGEKLSRKDRELFEQNFLCSDARKERVKSSRALMTFADAHAAAATRVSWWQRLQSPFTGESPTMRLVLATGFIILIIGAPLVLFQMNKLRSDMKALKSEQLSQNQREKELEQSLAQQKQKNDELSQSINRERGERGRLEQEVARLREQQAPPVTVGLGFGEIERGKGATGAQATKVRVPRAAEMIRMQLDLFKDDYESYLVVLEDAQQHDIWRGLLQSTKAGRGKAVVVRLPSRLFTGGRYKLTLSGTNNNGEYEVISEYAVDVIRE